MNLSFTNRLCETMIQKTKGIIWTLICVALWALIPVVSKTGQSSLDNHQFLFYSSLISGVTLFTISCVRGKLSLFIRLNLKQLLSYFVLGLLGTYIYYLFLYFGYAEGNGIDVLVIQYTWPLFIVILSIIFLGEQVHLQQFISIICGFAGMLIVLTKGNFSDLSTLSDPVMLLVALGAISFALFSVLSKKVTGDPMVITTIYFFAATIASFISMFIFSNFSLPGTQEFLPIAVNGILVNGLSYVFWIFALRSTSASFLAPFIYLTPIISMIYLVLFFSEPFGLASAIGLILVLVGGLVNTVGLRKYHRSSPKEDPVP